ncbi:DUF2892 domain-containing protein [Trinickia sp. NRRL B-1857]|uniref:YgaP family membrane protein n=1 Tax=Trinickia sp. NRRL B-1857 TaxID=3162879 RepID=UPI003D29803F
MTSWQITRIGAGLIVLVTLSLGAPASPFFVSAWWLWATAFVGANLLQSGFTQWCPMEIVMRKLGVRGGA